jgi:hypothetical protein
LIGDGSVLCWGKNMYGQLGFSSTNNYWPTPYKLPVPPGAPPT